MSFLGGLGRPVLGKVEDSTQGVRMLRTRVSACAREWRKEGLWRLACLGGRGSGGPELVVLTLSSWLESFTTASVIL